MSSLYKKIKSIISKPPVPQPEKDVTADVLVSKTPNTKTNQSKKGSNLVSKAGSSKTKVIAKNDDLPRYLSVLGDDSSGFRISPEAMKSYAVLLLNSERKEVVIACSTETKSYLSSEPDMDYLAIAQSVSRHGYIRRGSPKIFVTPEILSIIYDNQNTGLSAEEQKRTATKIQLDFDELLMAALEEKVSDIHIEVRRNKAMVRFRKHGDLYDYQEWSVTHARTMAGVIYQVIADEKDTSFDESRPQDALIDRTLGDDIQLRVRLVTIPGYPSGFDMIMRVLRMGQNGERQSLDELGYEKVQLTAIRRAVSKPVGAVIMAGTTGSGKSTSLNSMLAEKIMQYGGTLKVITVEDPPEYVLEGATQVPVVRSRSKAKASSAEENPFASVVRAAMRSDPDILSVGEVRDEDSAELLIHAVQSGHQVFTTVHASSAIDIISRLRSNGIPDDVLGGQNFISALMYQSLVPILCPHCSADIEKFKSIITSEQDHDCLERIYKYVKPSLIDRLRFENPSGCIHCYGGRIGRSVASEVILPDPYMLGCFRNKQDTDAFMHYRRRGGKIALEHGILKALRGQVDIRMVEAKLDQLTALEEIHVSMMAYNKENIDSSAPFVIDEDIFPGASIEIDVEHNLHEQPNSNATEPPASNPIEDSSGEEDRIQLPDEMKADGANHQIRASSQEKKPVAKSKLLSTEQPRHRASVHPIITGQDNKNNS